MFDRNAKAAASVMLHHAQALMRQHSTAKLLALCSFDILMTDGRLQIDE